jgi:hypothetical protein
VLVALGFGVFGVSGIGDRWTLTSPVCNIQEVALLPQVIVISSHILLTFFFEEVIAGLDLLIFHHC